MKYVRPTEKTPEGTWRVKTAVGLVLMGNRAGARPHSTPWGVGKCLTACWSVALKGKSTDSWRSLISRVNANLLGLIFRVWEMHPCCSPESA